MFRIVVEAADNAGFSERSGTAKDGRRYAIRRQWVYMYNGRQHPTPVELNLGDGENARKPYEPGEYTLASICYKLGARGIELDPYNIELEPVPGRPTGGIAAPVKPQV